MSGADYLSVEEAVGLAGLRIAFTRGAPGPWSVAARAIVDIKGIDYVAVAQMAGQPNEALQAWTGQNSAPVAMLNDERPRAHWSELLLLAERLAPEPRLIPEDQEDRTTMWGLAHELCGEDGLGWSLRAMIFAATSGVGGRDLSSMIRKYSSGTSPDHSRARADRLLGFLARRLERQAVAGSAYFVGTALSAPDIYWMAFSNMLEPMSEDMCPMPDYYRQFAPLCCSLLAEPLPRILIDHRDRIARTYLTLPIRC